MAKTAYRQHQGPTAWRALYMHGAQQLVMAIDYVGQPKAAVGNFELKAGGKPLASRLIDLA